MKIKLGFLHVLALVFITLKLCGVLSWSWWLVLSPLLVWGALVGLLLGLTVLFAILK